MQKIASKSYGLTPVNHPKNPFCKVEPFPYLFPDEARVEGMIETLTPYLRRIPEAERREFIQEFAQEYMKSCPVHQTGESKAYVWDAECLVVVMKKTRAV